MRLISSYNQKDLSKTTTYSEGTVLHPSSAYRCSTYVNVASCQHTHARNAVEFCCKWTLTHENRLRAGDNKTFTRKRLHHLFEINGFSILSDSYEKDFVQIIKAKKT